MIELCHNDMSVMRANGVCSAEKSHRLSLSETRHWHGRARKVSREVPDPGKHERSWENITQRRGIPLLPRIDKALRQTARRHGDGAGRLHPSYVLRSWIGISAPRLEKSPADDK